MSNRVIFDTKGLDKLIKSAKGKPFAKVGILQGTDGRSSGEQNSNVLIGTVHEFGSITKKIPARSFLRMPINLKADVIKEAGASGFLDELVGGEGLSDSVKRMGLAAEAVVQEAFSTNGFGQWTPNSEETIARKGSSAPLIDTGQLRRAVTSEVVDG